MDVAGRPFTITLRAATDIHNAGQYRTCVAQWHRSWRVSSSPCMGSDLQLKRRSMYGVHLGLEL
jgi:hypothetical protein